MKAFPQKFQYHISVFFQEKADGFLPLAYKNKFSAVAQEVDI